MKRTGAKETQSSTRHDEPPRPPQRHRWATACAKWAGRRDGRRRLAADESGHRPYTRLIEARVHREENALDAWLHTAVAPVDREAARRADDLVRIVHRLERLEVEVAETTALAGNTTGVAAVAARRRVARLEAERRELHERADEARRELSGLLQLRRHLLEMARGAAAGWEAYYRTVASSYQDALHRRNRASDPRAPGFAPFLAWVSGDLPLLAVTIDPEAERLLTIDRAEFWTGEAA